MTIYVDDVRHAFRRMQMCHMWSDSALAELLEMADRIGVQRKWLQAPPKASWTHFDISLGRKQLALQAGAILTDRFGPAAHVAGLRGDYQMLDRIAKSRALRNLPPDGIIGVRHATASQAADLFSAQGPAS